MQVAFPRPYRIFVNPPGLHVAGISMLIEGNGKDEIEWYVRDGLENVLKNSTEKKPITLDIGANIGIHALYLASKGLKF